MIEVLAMYGQSYKKIWEWYAKNITSIFHILYNNLQLRYACSRWVPHHLTKEQMYTRIHQLETDASKWSKFPKDYNNRWWNLSAHHFDSSFKSTTSLWKHTNSFLPKTIKCIKSADEVMMIIFFDHKRCNLSVGCLSQN